MIFFVCLCLCLCLCVSVCVCFVLFCLNLVSVCYLALCMVEAGLGGPQQSQQYQQNPPQQPQQGQVNPPLPRHPERPNQEMIDGRDDPPPSYDDVVEEPGE